MATSARPNPVSPMTKLATQTTRAPAAQARVTAHIIPGVGGDRLAASAGSTEVEQMLSLGSRSSYDRGGKDVGAVSAEDEALFRVVAERRGIAPNESRSTRTARVRRSTWTQGCHHLPVIRGSIPAATG